MGVQFLLSYIESSGVLQKVELSLLAERIFNLTEKKPKLLCDFLNLEIWFWSRPVVALIKSKDYPEHSKMYGGDYHLFADRARCFVKALNFIGIEPIFFVDGPAGSDDNYEGKVPVLYERYERSMKSLAEVEQVCKGSLPVYSKVHCHSSVIVQCLMALQEAGAEIVYCCGEADPEIVRYAQSHDETCGILSCDSDFAISSGCIMFPIDCFDLENTLGLSSVVIDDKPGEILCAAVCPADVAEHLGIRETQLPDLATLCGNDYTRTVLKRLSVLTKLGVEGSDIESVASWLKDKESLLLDYEPMRDLCLDHPDLRVAVEQSYTNYTVGRPAIVDSSDLSYASPLYSLIKEEASEGKRISVFLAIAKSGITWLSARYESVTLGQPCFSDVHLPVRNVMYTLLGVKEVREIGRTLYHSCDDVVVPVCVNPGEASVGVECFQKLRLLDRKRKLIALYTLLTRAPLVKNPTDVKEILSEVVSSSLSFPDLDWSKLYQIVMLCSCLRLVYCLTHVAKPSLDLLDGELDALMVSCLTCSTSGEIPPHLTDVRPSMRTIAVGEWFSSCVSNCYKFTYLLQLYEGTPEPRNLFYPMAFSPYHIMLEAKPAIKEEYRVGIDYIRNAMQTALNLPGVKALREAVLGANDETALPSIVSLFSAAQEEVLANQGLLLPRVMVTDLSEDEKSPHTTDEESSPSPDEDATTPDGSNSAHKSRPVQLTESQCDNSLPSALANANPDAAMKQSELEKLKDAVHRLELKSRGPLVKQAKGLGPASGYSTQQKVLKERLWGRDELPITEHREEILEMICNYQVVFVEGETGCGKSSQVPQFILNQATLSNPPHECRILVNQPNLLAAKKLAERVAEERKEMIGDAVGYCGELEKYPKDRTPSLTFCTTGYMLQILQRVKTNSCVYSHIILDEVHERSTDIDFTMLIIRQLVVNCPDVKLILMSATLQGSLFAEYFQKELGKHKVASPIFVGVKRFPVKEFCIDELGELLSSNEVPSDEAQYKASKELQYQLDKFAKDPSVLPLVKAEVTEYAQDVCINLLISQPDPGAAVLVFIPGMSNISEFHHKLHGRLRRLGIRQRFTIFILHNQVAREEQEDAFKPPLQGTANIILANKTAESSLTFPDLKLVINFGISREGVYDTKKHITKLTRRWCSRASCVQRAGRVGRVSEGIAIHLIPREFYEKLPDFNPPEIVDAPLSKTFLKAKEVCSELDGPFLPSQVLSLVIQPPSLLQFEAALYDLAESGALVHSPHSKVISEESSTTLLGRFSVSLPLDLTLCRLVLFGVMFGCPLDAIVFAAAMSMYQDVFTLPTKMVQDLDQFCNSLARSTCSRLKFDDRSYSNPIMMRNMFIEWLRFRNSSRNMHDNRRDVANKFCRLHAVRVGRLLHFEAYVGEIARGVVTCIPPGSLLYLELQSLAGVENSGGDPQYCDNRYFTEDGISQPSLRPTHRKYVPPTLRNIYTQRRCRSKSLHFCNNYVVLKAMIASASGTFMCGERKSESHEPLRRSTSRKGLKMMEATCSPTNRSLAMNLKRLEEVDIWAEELDKTDQSSIEALFNSLPRGYRFPLKISADDDTAVVHFLPSSDNPRVSNSLHRIAETMELPLPRAVQAEGHASESHRPHIAPLPLELEFFLRFGEQRRTWEIDEVNSVFPKPFHPFALSWYKLTEDRKHINTGWLNWRNPTAHMSAFDECTQPYFAVVSGILSTDGGSHLATDFSVLPSTPEGLLILLAFQLPTSAVELLIDTQCKCVKGLTVNSLEIPCTDIDEILSARKLDAINKLRAAISRAMALPLSNGCIPLSNFLTRSIPSLLQKVISTEDRSPSSAKSSCVDTASPHDGSDNLVWEMVTVGTLTQHNRPKSLPNKATFFYPEFQCSLLHTEPYAVREVKRERDFVASYSVDYVQTAAARILSKQKPFELDESKDELARSSTNLENVEDQNGMSQWRGGSKLRKKLETSQEASCKAENTSSGGNVDTVSQLSIEVKEEVKSPRNEQAISTNMDCKESEHDRISSKGLPLPNTSPPMDKATLDINTVSRLKLEQEVVRHLQRNNKMEFMSELKAQQRIKFLCQAYELKFDIGFLLGRPELFEVREVKQEGEDPDADEQEYLVVLHPSKWDEDKDAEEEPPPLTKSMQLIRSARVSGTQPVKLSTGTREDGTIVEQMNRQLQRDSLDPSESLTGYGSALPHAATSKRADTKEKSSTESASGVSDPPIQSRADQGTGDSVHQDVTMPTSSTASMEAKGFSDTAMSTGTALPMNSDSMKAQPIRSAESSETQDGVNKDPLGSKPGHLSQSSKGEKSTSAGSEVPVTSADKGRRSSEHLHSDAYSGDLDIEHETVYQVTESKGKSPTRDPSVMSKSGETSATSDSRDPNTAPTTESPTAGEEENLTAQSGIDDEQIHSVAEQASFPGTANMDIPHIHSSNVSSIVRLEATERANIKPASAARTVLCSDSDDRKSEPKPTHLDDGSALQGEGNKRQTHSYTPQNSSKSKTEEDTPGTPTRPISSEQHGSDNPKGTVSATEDSRTRKKEYSHGSGMDAISKSQAVPKRKATTPQPGTEEHLAEYLVNFIRSQGKPVRILELRKVVLKQYCIKYKIHTTLRTAFLESHPELFEIYAKQSGAKYVKVVDRHRQHSEATKTTKMSESAAIAKDRVQSPVASEYNTPGPVKSTVSEQKSPKNVQKSASTQQHKK